MTGTTQTAQEPVGDLATALAHTEQLVRSRPDLALEQVGEILKVIPSQPEAIALRGIALGALGQNVAAIASLQEAVRQKPGLVVAWRALGDQLLLAGDATGADAAYGQHIKASANNPILLQAADALLANKLAIAEPILRDYLKSFPTDVAAIRMLAEIAIRLARHEDAEKLLARALDLAPSFTAARHNYALVLYRANKAVESLAQLNLLLRDDPHNPSYRNLWAAVLVKIGDYEQAIKIYEQTLQAYPNQPLGWMSYGHALKTVGRQADSIAAYRRGLALQPHLGEAWWSLANLKTVRLNSDDIAALHRQLARTDISAEDRFHLHFTLGKAYEDGADYAHSFEHYAQGNRLRRELIAYDATTHHLDMQRTRAVLSPALLAAHSGAGCLAPDPIFIVGLPRSGSTLIEQILASHSQVEGTTELPDIIALTRRLARQGKEYPDVLADLSAEELRALGEEYLATTRIQRTLGKPYFIDKMPNNWLHVGLIHLILPNARIIDARRHPLGCCFSGYKQHFARGQHYTYDLREIGSYYRDYVELMAHIDEVLPGRVHRVIYEQMVADTDQEIRRLLDYVGLPFEDRCLRYWETDRAIRTASSEQVRQPIFTDGLDQWRHYEPWLAPLKSALGNVLGAYPDVPDFD